MSKTMFVSILSLIILLLCSCSDLTLNGKIKSITLICNHRIVNCSDRYYDDEDIIREFVRAIEKAKEMEGELDYEEEYTMIITFENKTERQFHISLTTSRGNTGLLLELPDTMQGYKIPVSNADKLRDILY